MKVFRIDITSWTASFRYPNLISGFQPTLEVPPLSTVLGIFNAAAGKYLIHSDLSLGYFFRFEMKGIDLETIYQINSKNGRPSNNAKSNVIQREFLFQNTLSLYLKDPLIVSYLEKPIYPILLGRSNDLATVSKPIEMELLEIEAASKIKGQIVPLSENFLPGKIQALPKYFSNDFPRQNLGTEPYSVIGFQAPDLKTNLTGFRDESQVKEGVDIFFHELDFSKYYVL